MFGAYDPNSWSRGGHIIVLLSNPSKVGLLPPPLPSRLPYPTGVEMAVVTLLSNPSRVGLLPPPLPSLQPHYPAGLAVA